MAKNIDAILNSIQGLFTNAGSQNSVLGKDGFFIVPEYQRAYNWRANEQCDKLWQDVESFIETKKNDSYFLGSIIINSDRDQLYIIDGQQRVTTFLLLLKALLLRINGLLQTMSFDDDSRSVKNGLENRRNSILGCLYRIDEDDISLVTGGQMRLCDLKTKYDNQSMNEEYAGDVKAILHGQTYQEIESGVTKLKYKQGENKYTNFFRNFATYFFLNKEKPIEEKRSFAAALLKLFALLSISEYGYSSSKFKVFLIGMNMEIGAGVSTEALVRLIREHIRKNFEKAAVRQALLEAAPDAGLVYLNEYLFAKERGRPVDFSSRKIEIEHIMPASGKNIVAVRADANMEEDVFNRYVNQLGNLILLEQYINGSLSNDWFRVKKQNSVNDKRGYKDSVFPLARSLVAYSRDKWGKDDITAATEKAAQRIADFLFDDEE